MEYRPFSPTPHLSPRPSPPSLTSRGVRVNRIHLIAGAIKQVRAVGGLGVASQPLWSGTHACVCVQPLCPDCFISPRAPTLPPLGVRLSSRLRLKEELDWGDGEWPGAWYSSELCTLSVPWCSTELGAGRVLSTASQMVLWIPQSVRGWVGILEELGCSGHIASHRSCLRMLLLLGLLL